MLLHALPAQAAASQASRARSGTSTRRWRRTARSRPNGVPTRRCGLRFRRLRGRPRRHARVHRAPRAHWLGYSMGARLALACALRSPASVASLSSWGRGPASGSRGARRAAPRRRGARRSHRALGVEAFVDEWLAQPLFATQRRLGAAFLEEQRRARLARTHAASRPASARSGPGTAAAVRRAVAGARARPARHRRARRALRRPRARPRPAPAAGRGLRDRGCGHAVHLEQPGAFLRAVDDFLRRVQTRVLPAFESVQEIAS